MFTLKEFQEKAISELREQFLNLWQSENRQVPLVFKSPTGSGKTVMMAQFLKDLANDPQFNEDLAFLWFSFNADSYKQSKKKLLKYYGGASELDLLDLNDLTEGKMHKNDVFFINWQKIKTSTKEGRRLRRENEQGTNFDSFINNTQEDNRALVLIVDESHRETDTELAEELVNLVDPRIILRVTATPKYEPKVSEVQKGEAGFVGVDHGKVVESGLIKEKIVTQTKEDLEEEAEKELDQDYMLLNLAYDKRLELKELYGEMDLDINPLVLIQLPNDDQAREETLSKSKLEIVKDYLYEKGETEESVAIWLAEEKENLELIENNDSEVNFLIFKQAAATSWDCPRASILVMFREIKSPVFHKQTVGRILRMPEAKHYSVSDLNISYLYTNYNRNQVLAEFEEKDKNRPANLKSYRKDSIEPITLQSTYMSRTDYNDLGSSFQETFIGVANDEFSIKEEDNLPDREEKLEEKGLELDNPSVKDKMVVDAEIENYDNFIKNLEETTGETSTEISRNDLERTYNLLCFNIISSQGSDDRKFAPERSWGKLKTALNVWIENNTDLKRGIYYKVIVSDLLRNKSVLKPIISDALAKYRPIREKEVQRKAERARQTREIELPPEILSFTDLYEQKDVEKCAMGPFYIQEGYKGKENEENFINYLEAHGDVRWWYKNRDSGTEHFSIAYLNEDSSEEELFYPDWIVKTKNQLYVFDTKGGSTAKSDETKFKANDLQEWLEDKEEIEGGITVYNESKERWMINRNKQYSYDSSFEGWQLLDEVIQ